MIDLKPTEARVYNAYLEIRNVSKVGKKLGMKVHLVRRRLDEFTELGLLEQMVDGTYVPTGEEFVVRTSVNRMICPVAITPQEEDWMLNHYKKYRNLCRYVAKVLGRTRLEVNYMAMALGLDIREGV